MKTQLILLTLVAAVLAGCTESDDPAPEPVLEPVAMEPSYENVQPASVTGLEFVAQVQHADGAAFPSGSGIWVHGDRAYGSALGNGFFIVDISDPASPVLLWNATVDQDEGNNTETSFSRDADLIAHPDGRLTLVLATQTNGMHLWDVTDPTAPVLASIVSDIGPNHNVAVIPGTELVFNSQSGGLGRTNEIIDARDPYNAYVLGQFGDHGCHDITFYGMYHEGDDMGHNHDKFRAYCAGIQRTEIWNLDSFDPATASGIEVIGLVEFGPDSPVIGNPAFQSYPVRTLHHLAMVNEDASVLIIGDEQNGGGTPGACYVYEDNTGVSTPFGALWFYDLSDETAPSLQGWISAPTIVPDAPGVPDPTTVIDPNNPTNVLRPVTNGVPNCTAHFGSLVPGEEKLVMSWYSAGVVLIDFSDISSPRILDQYQADPTNPWDARIHGGYVYTGDIVRGMDVLRLT
ncbi:MAG: LVIVD repeat-containing protein [Thermoplasmatota archaeon]